MHCPIVGIGASAGGLEAFTRLLQNLPSDTGMAFVLVQHLDPDHESALTQLLARTTSMVVNEVTHGVAVAPNRVYVIPPNTNMTITRGVLKLQPRRKTAGPHRSIDFFFESLAQDQRERAIGVILSGTATDGTHGLEMIKAEGGFTFAQDDSSKYDSMPRSAVAAGCVDLVLPPKEIAKELARIAKHPLVAARRTKSTARPSPVAASSDRGNRAPDSDLGQWTFAHPGAENAFKKILHLLRNHRGVDFSLYKPNTIQRRITRRMVLNKQKALGDYAQFLKDNPKELDLLYSDVLLNVTSFFRNPQAFEALKRKVFPDLLEHQGPEEPVRVWTLGCSTGQEPYSIAMAFTEFCDKFPRAPKLQIFATDLNEPLLEKARHGFYSKSLVADVSPERLRRFFIEEQGGYRICKSLRELCVFARQNVLSDPPFSRMDLISCRNLMIYFELESQKRILPNLHYALKPGGFLFLGASESVGVFTNLFTPADKKQKIFCKKPGAAAAYHLPVSHGHPAEKKGIALARQKTPPDRFRTELNAQREADRVMVNQFAPPGALINSHLEVLQFRGCTSAFLEPPTGKATFDLLKMARAGLMLPLRAAINEAKKKQDRVCRKNVRLDENNRARLVNIQVIPLKNLKEPHYLILFEEASKAGAGGSPPFEQPIEGRPTPRTARAIAGRESRRIAELERDLAEARDYAQSLQEQHEAANEEIQVSSEEVQSANEELQSINEELETSQEELESTNEELTTVNEELAGRNTELNRLNSDLNNFQASTKLPIVLLGRDLSIRHFSPQAEKQFNLAASDVGRHFGKVRHDLDLPDLEAFITEVIRSVREREREVRDQQGRWHLLHVRPYIASDNKVDGAVLLLVDINALKESEQAVISARDFAESILRTVRDPFLILDADLRVERANEAFYSTFQVSPAESVGRTIFELDHGHWDVPRLRELLQDILPRHSFFNHFEVTTKFQHIGHRTMLLNARTLSEPSGQPARILLGIQDISELLRFQTQVRRSELRYRRLFEAARDGVLIIDPDTRKIIEANPFMTELLGYSHDALLGKELFEIGLLKDEEAVRAAFKELNKKGFIRYEDLPLETSNGQRREVEFVSNLYQEGGAKVIQCNVRDITERKLAERKFRGLLESAPDAMIITDREGHIELINAQTERLFGYARGELLGKQIEILIPQCCRDQHSGHPHNFLADSRARPMESGLELLGRRKDGTEFPVEISFSPVESESGILMSVAVRDITNRKKSEATLRLAQDQLASRASQLEHAVTERTTELTTANKQLEALIYTIAHDLRAPLRAMQGFSAMLVEEAGATLNEAGQIHAERISKSAQFMDLLLQDLLAFSRISQQRVELTSVNLETVVAPVLFRLQKEIQEKNARVDSLGPWPVVRAHEPTLAQALFNLTSNALKFVGPDAPPLVCLRAEEQGEFIRVWVEDNGIGIAPGHQEQIFRLFTRLHNEKYQGTGSGLAIVQKGIERMGGRVGLESTPGRGSRFWLELRKG